MNTLFITNTYLSEHSGVANASKSFIRAFAQLSDAMTVVYPFCEGEEMNGFPESNIVFLPVKDKRKKTIKFLGLLLGKTHRYSTETTQLFDKTKYDLAVFDASPVSFHLIKKAKDAGLKTITIHHNYQIEYSKDDIHFPLKVPVLFWTYFFERASVRNSDLNLTLTSEDAISLAKHYFSDGIFGIIGAFDYYNKELPQQVLLQGNNKDKAKVFVITGQLSSIQTEESLLPWLDDYYPLLLEKVPMCKLIIAGRNPSEKLINYCKVKGVEIIPSPKNMSDVLCKGDYFICPTSMGSGLKYRIMDGLGTGMQVLTHVRSARGYDEMERQKVLFSYNNTSSFVEKLTEMTERRMSKEEVFNIYQSYFSIEAGIKRLESILKQYHIL